MPITLSLDRDRANDVVKQALESMDTIDEYADEGSDIVATQKARGLGAGNAAKLTIKFWPDGDSTRIEYETKKGNPLDLTTDTEEIEREFRRSVQQLSETTGESRKQIDGEKKVESTSATTVTDAVQQAGETVNQVMKSTSSNNDSAESNYCPNCGTTVSETYEYCSECGTEFSSSGPSGTSENKGNSGNELAYRERVNEELDEGQIETDSNKSFSEQLSEIQETRKEESQAESKSQSTEDTAVASDTDDGNRIIKIVIAAVSTIISVLVGLVILIIGIYLMGSGVGLW
jgi:hypothetical protein